MESDDCKSDLRQSSLSSIFLIFPKIFILYFSYNLNYCIENGFKDKEEILKQVVSEWVECCAFSAQGPMNFVLYNRDQEKMEEINKNLYKEVNKFNKNLEKIFK